MHERTIVDLDDETIQEIDRLLAGATADDLGRPTPCAGWDLRALLEHMAAQHRGFAAAARGGGGDPEVWRVRSEGDPVAAHAQAGRGFVAAFREPGVDDRELSLPELSTEVTFPGRRAARFHLVDDVAHAWDVAMTLGVAYRPSPEVLAAALRIAAAVPDGPERTEPGAAFAPAIEVGAGASDLDRVVALLGRDPGWRPPA